MKRLIFALVMFASPAYAQQPQFYPVADRDLWEAMVKALDDIPMTLSAHQQVHQIMTNVQTESQRRKVASEAPAAK
jgi:hypothetical protein